MSPYCVLVACATVPNDFLVHSLHAYFVLAGDSNKQILFDVERIRDGSSFKTRSVKALQDNKAIFQLAASFHRKEPGAVYQKSLRDILGSSRADRLPPPESLEKGSKTAPTLSSRYLVDEGKDWTLFYVKVNRVTAGWQANCSLLAFLSDQGMVRVARKPHEEGDSDIEWSMSLSLDHSIHFHRPDAIQVHEWMIFYSSTLISSGARGTATTLVFNLKVSISFVSRRFVGSSF